jgi:hypothetical protein
MPHVKTSQTAGDAGNSNRITDVTDLEFFDFDAFNEDLSEDFSILFSEPRGNDPGDDNVLHDLHTPNKPASTQSVSDIIGKSGLGKCRILETVSGLAFINNTFQT